MYNDKSTLAILTGLTDLSTERRRAFCIVDGQYGSTGKGLAASWMAEVLRWNITGVVSNAGPNSGHTFYHRGKKHVLRQLPSSAVYLELEGCHVPVYLNAGAIVDPDVLIEECERYHFKPYIHREAAIVDEDDSITERKLVREIGSTGKGTGAALARKVMRRPFSTMGGCKNAISTNHEFDEGDDYHFYRRLPLEGRFLVEVSQGFSLGLNQGFYPFTTSRDCGVAQALSDADFHPEDYSGCLAVYRTFPIRVAGNSGPCYEDQKEISWADLKQEPELTTVTNKVRRVFTWSRQQFRESIYHNRPKIVLINFMNYLGNNWEAQNELMSWVQEDYEKVMGTKVPLLLTGWGPNVEDIFEWTIE